MAMASLYDLSPLLMLLGLGVLMAAGPLLWVWRRNRHASPQRRQQALTLLTLFLTFDLVLFGAFTRLSDSGLGCPDWPGCYGQASPLGAKAPIAAAQAAMPTGPVTHGKAWIEMIHRYLATSVGALILALTVMAWLARRSQPTGQSKEALSPWWPTFTLFWVCLQGAFGALTVTMKLFPAIVTLHLLGGVTLLVLLGGQAIRQTQVAQGLSPVAISTGLRRLLVLTTLLLVVQLALGGWVSTNYAVLACSEFPTCQGQWWPPMNFEQGFELWRGLGLRADGTPISFAALTAIHYAHRLMAVLVLGLLGLLAWRLKQFAPLRRLAGGLGALAILQLLTGLSNVVLGWPLLAALLHTGGAAALALLLTWVLLATRGRLGGWSSPDPAAFGIRA
jgi:cytochrome c oxidase assembly protein subunit 15